MALSEFGKAFADARRAGKKSFEFGGKNYHTRTAAEEAAAKKEIIAKTERFFQEKLNEYNKKKAELRVSDYEDAELAATSTFSITQQSILLRVSSDPALLVYTLGKNPQKLDELAKIEDPVDFTAAVARLESKITVKRREREAPPPPERVVSGSSGTSIRISSGELEKARAEAEKTGDYSKVAQIRRKLEAQKNLNNK